MRASKFWIVAVVVIAALALWFRARGIGADLPFIYDPDEPAFLDPAAKMLRTGDFNPHWFGHPGSTVIYINALIMAAAGGADAYFADPTSTVWAARFANALFGACAAVAACLVASRAFASRAVGIGAAAVVAFLPYHTLYSRVVRTDILAGLFVLLAVYFALRLMEQRRLYHYIAAGMMIGFGVATKYPAVLAAIPVVVAHGMSGRGWLREWWKLFIAGAAALVGAFIASPYLFLDIQSTLMWLSVEAANTPPGRTGQAGWPNLAWYLTSLYRNFGAVGVVVSLIGVGWAIWRRGAALVVLSFVIAFLVFLSLMNLRWERWLLPVFPFVGVFVAAGVVLVANLAGAMIKRREYAGLCGAVLSVAVAVFVGRKLLEPRPILPDTRTIARQWAIENIPAGSRIILEAYTPHMPLASYELYRFRGRKLIPADPSLYQNFIAGGFAGKSNLEGLQSGDYIMLSSSAYGRFEGTEGWARYEEILASGKTVYEISPKRGESTGPKIIIVKRD